MKRYIRSNESNWPQELTYADYDQGDQIVEGFLDTLDELDLDSEPAARGGHGTDFFVERSTGKTLDATIDLDEEDAMLDKLYWESTSPSDFKSRIIKYLKQELNI